ncbi:MAG: hypothetical protein C4346_17455, partial [Chloroflexota bacterium]
MGKVYIITACAIVVGSEAEEREPAVGEEPLLGIRAGEDLATVTGANLHLARAVEAEAVVKNGADARWSRHSDPA